MGGPILRATDMTGEVYEDPSEDALFMFMEDLESPGSSFQVERLEPDRVGEWARITRKEGGLYEFDGSEHVRFTSSLRPIHEFLTRWAFHLSSPDNER
jgi:hypothetical protein